MAGLHGNCFNAIIPFLFLLFMMKLDARAQATIEVDGMYYVRLSETEVGVTHDPQYGGIDGIFWPKHDSYYETVYETVDTYTGDVVIPETITYKNRVYRVTKILREAFRQCQKMTSLQIPSGIVSIDDYAFFHAKLKEITLPSELKSIGEWAFRGNFFKQIVLSNKLKKIGDYAFFEDFITDLTIPESVDSIGRSCFTDNEITSITFCGENEKYISLGAFEGCPITKVQVPSLKAWNNLDVTDDFNYSTNFSGGGGYDLYFGGEKVTNLVLTDMTYLRTPFAYCKSIQSVSMSSSVLILPDHAFYHCQNLKTVVIGSNVEYIGLSAFNECDGLEDVCCLAVRPPYIEWVWGDSPKNWPNPDEVAWTDLHVPYGTKETYRQNSKWSRFPFIDEVNPHDVFTEPEISEYIFYGICVENIDSIVNDKVAKLKYGFTLELQNTDLTILDLINKSIENSSIANTHHPYNIYDFTGCELQHHLTSFYPYEGVDIYLYFQLPDDMALVAASYLDLNGNGVIPTMEYNNYHCEYTNNYNQFYFWLVNPDREGDFEVWNRMKTYTAWGGQQVRYGDFGPRLLLVKKSLASDEDSLPEVSPQHKRNGDSGSVYDLFGRKVNSTYKGIVIKDGRKYILK